MADLLWDLMGFRSARTPSRAVQILSRQSHVPQPTQEVNKPETCGAPAP
jgi:hypothetical protein